MIQARFRGRAAVVTGGGSGIGRAMARAFSKAEMPVVVSDVDSTSANAVATEIRSEGGEALAIACDVSRFDEVEALASEAQDRLGPVALLCNNAGVGGGIGPPMSEISGDDWERVLAVNLGGVINGIRAFVPRMIDASMGGHIVNTASMAAFLPHSGTGPYTTTKFAIVGLSEVLRSELEPHGIGVSILCPGPFDTGIWGSDRSSNAGGDPAVLGPRVLAGAAANEPFIFTHPEFENVLSERFEGILRTLREAGPPMQHARTALS